MFFVGVSDLATKNLREFKPIVRMETGRLSRLGIVEIKISL